VEHALHADVHVRAAFLIFFPAILLHMLFVLHFLFLYPQEVPQDFFFCFGGVRGVENSEDNVQSDVHLG
jgi:hypothetical protein